MSNALNELHLLKDGMLDKEQLNYIVKNPEEPRCKYTITSLLNLYQKEKRKALSLNDSNVSYNEFKKFVKENLAKTQLTPEAEVKLKDLPDELCEKIVECLASQQLPRPSTSTSSSPASASATTTSNLMSKLKEIKQERCQTQHSDVEDTAEESFGSTTRTENERLAVVQTPKTVQKTSVQRKGKGKSQKNEPSLCESMFYVAVDRAQGSSLTKNKVKKGSDNLPSVVKEFEALLDKEGQLEKDVQKIDKDLTSTEKEKKKAEKELEKAEKKFNENMQKLMQALMLCDTLNEARDKAKEQYSSVQQRIDDLELLKKKIGEEKTKVDTRKSELLVYVIRESSATTKKGGKQGESAETINSADTTSHLDEQEEMQKIIRKKKQSASKRLQELASELDIGGVCFSESTAQVSQSDQVIDISDASDKVKSWKDNFVTMSLNTSSSPMKSTFTFQEVESSSKVSERSSTTKVCETQSKRARDSSTNSGSSSVCASSKSKVTEQSERKSKKSQKESEDRSKKSSAEPVTSVTSTPKKVTEKTREREEKTGKEKLVKQSGTEKKSETESRRREEKTEKRKEAEETRKRTGDDTTSERQNKITKFTDDRPSSASSSSNHSSSTSTSKKSNSSQLVIDNDVMKPKGFNAFRDIANHGRITAIKVHKDFVYIASDTGYLRKFNVNKLDNNLFFEGHTQAIKTFAVSKLTESLYTGCDDGKLRHYNSATSELKDSFHLCAPVTCMEQGKSVLYVGLQNGIIYRFGLMSNKLINSYSVAACKVQAIKLLAEYSDESRIIVCSPNSISVRNSSNGALLNAFPNSENLGFLSVSSSGLVYFLAFDPIKRGTVMRVRHEKNQVTSANDGLLVDPRVMAFEENDGYFYVGTYAGRIVCLRQMTDKCDLQWVSVLPNVGTYVTAFAVFGDTLLAAVSDGNVMKVSKDADGPHYCRDRFCNNKPFARKEDLDRHLKLDHWSEARRGSLYQCHVGNCRSVMSSSEVRRPYQRQPNRRTNYSHNYPHRGRGYYRRPY